MVRLFICNKKHYYLYSLSKGFGFLLPAESIIPNCEEIMDGMKGLVFKARELGYLQVTA